MEVFTVYTESYIPELIVGHVYKVRNIERDHWNRNKFLFSYGDIYVYCGRSKGSLYFIWCRHGIDKDILYWLMNRSACDFSKCDYEIRESELNSLNEDHTDTQLYLDPEEAMYGVTEFNSDKFFRLHFTKEYHLNASMFDEFEKVYVVYANGSIHAEEYVASNVLVDKYEIILPNGYTIASKDVGSGKVDICKNIINIHEG